MTKMVIKVVENYIMNMYKYGRKTNTSAIYLSQSFYSSPTFIRKNLMYLFLLKINGMNDLRLILKCYSMGIDFDKMIECYKDSIKQPFDVFKIDLFTRDDNKKLCKNFTGFYKLD